MSLERYLCDVPVAFCVKNGVGCLRKGIQHYKSHIVPGVFIFGTYVSEPDYKTVHLSVVQQTTTEPEQPERMHG